MDSGSPALARVRNDERLSVDNRRERRFKEGNLGFPLWRLSAAARSAEGKQ
jgi:hypothetical protein